MSDDLDDEVIGDDEEGMSDEDIRESLQEIDEADFEVSEWEAEFLESILFNWARALTEKQRECALRMIEKYEDKL